MSNGTTAEMHPRKIAHGSDEHLTLRGAPWHFNMLTGQDRKDMLAFGRACMEAANALRGQKPMPRRKRDSIQRRHDYLRSLPHDERNSFDESEIAALEWVLREFGA